MSFAYFDWIAHHAEVRGDKTALIDLATQRRLTYRALDERIDRLAAHLSSLGVKRGDRVAVLAPNTTDILEVQFACFRLAAIFVPLNTRLTVHELKVHPRRRRADRAAHDQEFETMAQELQKLWASRICLSSARLTNKRWPVRPALRRTKLSASMIFRRSCTLRAPRENRKAP